MRQAQNFKDGGYIRNNDVVAVASDETGVVIQKNKFSVGETLWVLEPERDPYPVTIELMADENGEAIESAPHAEMRVRLNFELPPFAILRRDRRI